MARQKITDSESGEDLPDISEPELEFCRLIVMENLDQSKAYRIAIDATPTDKAVWDRASRLRGTARVNRWVSYLRWQAGKTATCTITEHMNELQRLKDAAQAAGNYGAAVQAEQLRGKVAGHHIERIRDETERLDDDALVAAIGAILGDDIAAFAAAKLGVAPKTSKETEEGSRESTAPVVAPESRTVQ